jgi:sodium/hydrogen antiporter
VSGFLQKWTKMMLMNAESLAASLAIIGVVIIVSALLSGLIDRTGMPQVGVFLAMGAILGPFGLGAVNISYDSAALRTVAVLSLALVLFTDAVALNIAEVRRRSTLALRLLGPGTLLTAALIGLAGWWLLKLSPPAAAVLGAALASTDPVLLRGLLQRRDIPEDARQPLRLESGLNDIVLLPIVLVALAFMTQNPPLSGTGYGKLCLNLFVLGPGAGILVGLIGIGALDLIRKRVGVRRDYESLYSIGVAFAAFAAAEALHGSGFLAAFNAGMIIAILDVELCDCFVEYGAVTAEMFLMLTFVLLGNSLIWSGFAIISGPALLFVAIAVLIRTPVYLLSLIGSDVDMRGRLLIAWFGPRGLSSLLLILLPVFAGVPDGRFLFAVCSLVVLVSVILHGGSPMLLARIARRRARKAQQTGTPAADGAIKISQDGNPDRAGAATAADGVPSLAPDRITLEQLQELWRAGQPVVILDVRSERSLEGSDTQAKHAIRMPPDHVADRAKELGLSPETWIVAYCA